MGSAYDGHEAIADAKKLGRAVYRAAKELSATTTDPYGKITGGGRLSTSDVYKGGVPLLKGHHKSSIYEGMVREEKTYERATQSKYLTFRTISTSVRDRSWWRKPIMARHYMTKVATFVDRILPQAFEAFIEAQK